MKRYNYITSSQTKSITYLNFTLRRYKSMLIYLLLYDENQSQKKESIE